MTGTADEREAKAAWTVLVYMAGDNNLTEEMAWGLQELKKTAAELDARAKGRIKVVAHFDPRGSRSRRYDFLPSATHIPLERARRDGNVHSYEAMIYTRRSDAGGNGSQPRAAAPHGAALSNPLAVFVHDQIAKLARAERYFLILSGHGSGSVGDFLNASDPGTSLSIPQLARILEAARTAYEENAQAGRKGERPKIDILGMDSCLMSNAEVCYEIREHAHYLVASEGWVANAGWPYHRVLEACLADGSKADLDRGSVAERVANNYADFYQDYEIAGISTDIAVCGLDAFLAEGEQGLIGRLQALSRACIESFDGVYVRDIRSRTAIDEEKEHALRTYLCGQIAGLLCKDESQKKGMSDELARGSAKARETLGTVPEFDKLSSSQLKAVRELLESTGGAYGLSRENLKTQAQARWNDLVAALDKPGSWSSALAAVRLLREFDPGVLDVLKIIEAQERDGRSEAKQARVLLQKLHQVQWVLELDELSKHLKEDSADVQLLNAVVASRWRAQSFKAGVYVDLIDLCECLAERLDGHPAQAPCRQVGTATSGAVSMSRYTGAASQHARGLSVYFPSHAADYASEYDNLAFAGKTGWGRLVRAYLRATRRERRDEQRHWANAADHVLRFGHSEVDPLEADGIEARIVGVIAPTRVGERPAKPDGKEGTETKIREGTETKIREGTEAKIRGEGVLFVWGNPPDGFFRQAESGKWVAKGEGTPRPSLRT